MMNPARSPYALGVTGYPLGHSLSPRLHAAALGATGLAGQYRLYPVRPLPEGQVELEALIARLRDGSLQGLNVTIPHKQAVIVYLDELTPLARRIGAVNTIFRRAGHRHESNLIGDNTDAPGFLADLKKQLPQTTTPGRALVLGAGGSGRAVAYALLSAGWQVAIAARRPEKAAEILAGWSSQPGITAAARTGEAIALESLPEQVFTWCAASQGAGPSLVVNTTPVGMHPDVAASPWPDGIPFPPGAALYDLVYNPMETALVLSARRAGLQAANGLGMLIEQAALSFERWTGVRPPAEAMRRAVA